ncbi:MAG: LysM peptidoglycan-binding domain-containing protein, partial [Anaerolineales bacterium]
MKRLFLFVLLLFPLALLAHRVGAITSAQQPYSTPTPGPDGRILYIVQPGDNCQSIADRHGLTLTQLRALNNLDETCLLQPGQVLFIGIGGPAAPSPTPAISPTPEFPTPNPNPRSGTHQISVMVYED